MRVQKYFFRRSRSNNQIIREIEQNITMHKNTQLCSGPEGSRKLWIINFWIHPTTLLVYQITHFWREIQIQGLEKALEQVPGPKNIEKIKKMLVLVPLGLVTLVNQALRSFEKHNSARNRLSGLRAQVNAWRSYKKWHSGFARHAKPCARHAKPWQP